MRILFLLPSLGFNASAKQALMLVQHLAAQSKVRVGVLGEEGDWGDELRRCGVELDCFHWTRPLDPAPLWRLRCLLKDFEPDCIHLWGVTALRSLALVGQRYLTRTVVSRCRGAGTALPRLDRWLLGRVAAVIAGGQAEADWLRSAGVAGARIVVVRPGIAAAKRIAEPGSDVAAREKAVVCVGPLEARKGLREAIWAGDFLFYAFQDLQLWLIGEGAYHEKLRDFSRSAIWHPDRVRFLGARPQLAGWLARAAVCWVPSLAPTGRQAVLEAQAAGCPVVASDLPHLREVIVDGETGALVRPGDKMALAVKTRHLLLDPALRQRLAQAGRQQARENFSVEKFVQGVAEIYQALPLAA